MGKTKIGGIIPTPLRQELYMAVDIKGLDGLGDLATSATADYQLNWPEHELRDLLRISSDRAGFSSRAL